MAPVITRTPSEENVSVAYNEQIPLGEYLFLRIAQANPKLRSVFGIPGDFNLNLLEHLYTDSVAEKMEFVGICNELNAAYAADGYAKIIDGLSVLITTYGVGELSALNGVAGAFAEFAPVLHIVGTTSTKQVAQAKSASGADVRNIHHLVQNTNSLVAPDHDVYKRACESFSVAQESLDADSSDANLAKIDRVIAKVILERRPGYIFIPSDAPDVFVPRLRLAVSLPLEELRDESLLNEVSSTILNRLYNAEKPSIIGDALVSRFGAQEPLNRFLAAMPSNFVKLFTSPMGRNVDETLSNFVGVYGAKLSSTVGVTQCLEQDSDFLLTLGFLNNEVNCGMYSANFSNISENIVVHPDYVCINGEYVHIKDHTTGIRAFSIGDLMAKLAADFRASKFVHNDGKVNNISYLYVPQQFTLEDESQQIPSEVITQNKLTDFFNQYLREDDILMVETCSFLFGISDLRFPKGVQFFSQNFYGSIGYALPATLGVARAERDLNTKRRVILVQGDGSAQMTIQELSSYLRYDIQPPQIFLLNNEGYTVERLIKGPTRSYNDIQDTWQWTKFFEIFGDAQREKHLSKVVSTATELGQLLGRKASGKIEMLELHLAKLDVPQRFKNLLGK